MENGHVRGAQLPRPDIHLRAGPMQKSRVRDQDAKTFNEVEMPGVCDERLHEWFDVLMVAKETPVIARCHLLLAILFVIRW